MNKKQVFYKELKDVIRNSYISNKDLREGHEIRNNIEKDIQEYVSNQKILKKVSKGLIHQSVVSYIIGEIIYELNYKGETIEERKTFILNMSQYVYDMFCLGKNPLCSADVYILINNQNHWHKYLN